MTDLQFIGLVLILSLATMITRAVPFFIFGKSEKIPKLIDYLGKVLPAAMMGLLVVYCFKDTDISDTAQMVPAVCASAAVIVMHLWKRNTIFSITLGTAVYMILIR